MRLPKFLRFLEPRFITPASDGLKVVGHMRLERQVRGGPMELVVDQKNFIVDIGVTAIRDILIGPNGSGFTGSIFRMGIGDGGVPPGELFNPKLPDATWPARTGLYHEVIRQDIAVFSTPTAMSMRFVGSFLSTDVDLSSYSLADNVVNEASLIVGDGILTIGGDKRQINSNLGSPLDEVDADEQMFSTRTFKSVSFDPSEDVTLALTWTITITS